MELKKLLATITLGIIFLTSHFLMAATINVPTDYSTIQAAITAASAGDLINVAAGTYNENLNIDATKDNLTIQGADKTTTTINVTGSYGIMIYADGVTFDGFTVVQNNAAVVQKALALMNGATGCTVSNCIFDGTGSTKSGSMGILVRDSHNIIDNVESFAWAGYGIDVYSAGVPYADDVTIKNSTFRDNGWFNIAIDRSTNVRIEDCTSSGGGTGIAFFEASGAPVAGGSVKGCIIHGATYDGIRLVGSDIDVENNEIYGCSTTTDPSAPPSGYAGIRITTDRWPYYAANKDTVIKNKVHDNLGHSVLIDYGTHPEPIENFFSCNDFVNNAYDFDASTLTAVVPAENCWWGNASGPSGVGPGSGDAVSVNVDYDPWLATPWENDNTCNPPTAINLSSFYAYLVDDAVQILWSTETEPNNVGFNIYRSSENASEYQQINENLILAEGDAATGASYSYNDRPEQAGTYYYKLQDVSVDGQTTFHGPIEVAGVTSVEDGSVINPDKYQLFQNHPNPFNPTTEIRFTIPVSGNVSIKIYDIQGQLVRNLVSEQKAAGSYSVNWDSRDENGVKVTSGVYFYQIDAGEFTLSKKMILMK